MWVKIVVPFVLLPMLLHSVAGCCWHHTHSDFSITCEHASHDDDVDHSHAIVLSQAICHSHAGVPDASKSIPVKPSPKREHEPCDELHCVYAGVAIARKSDGKLVVPSRMTSEIGHTMRPNLPFTMTECSHRNHHALRAQQYCALRQVWVV